MKGRKRPPLTGVCLQDEESHGRETDEQEKHRSFTRRARRPSGDHPPRQAACGLCRERTRTGEELEDKGLLTGEFLVVPHDLLVGSVWALPSRSSRDPGRQDRCSTPATFSYKRCVRPSPSLNSPPPPAALTSLGNEGLPGLFLHQNTGSVLLCLTPSHAGPREPAYRGYPRVSIPAEAGTSTTGGLVRREPTGPLSANRSPQVDTGLGASHVHPRLLGSREEALMCVCPRPSPPARPHEPLYLLLLGSPCPWLTWTPRSLPTQPTRGVREGPLCRLSSGGDPPARTRGAHCLGRAVSDWPAPRRGPDALPSPLQTRRRKVFVDQQEKPVPSRCASWPGRDEGAGKGDLPKGFSFYLDCLKTEPRGCVLENRLYFCKR